VFESERPHFLTLLYNHILVGDGFWCNHGPRRRAFPKDDPCLWGAPELAIRVVTYGARTAAGINSYSVKVRFLVS
jgi:hypothetical protein